MVYAGEEIDLCDHTMFGATFVIFNYYDKESETVYFDTLSGELIVNRKRSLWDGFSKIWIDGSRHKQGNNRCYWLWTKKAFMRHDLLCIFNDEDIVMDLTPDLEKAKNLDGLLLQVIAPINLSLYN